MHVRERFGWRERVNRDEKTIAYQNIRLGTYIKLKTLLPPLVIGKAKKKSNKVTAWKGRP